MTKPAKKQTAAQFLSRTERTATNKEADQRWMLDALEDDEVRENLKVLRSSDRQQAD